MNNLREGGSYIFHSFMEAAGFTVGRARAYTGAAANLAGQVREGVGASSLECNYLQLQAGRLESDLYVSLLQTVTCSGKAPFQCHQTTYSRADIPSPDNLL